MKECIVTITNSEQAEYVSVLSIKSEEDEQTVLRAIAAGDIKQTFETCGDVPECVYLNVDVPFSPLAVIIQYENYHKAVTLTKVVPFSISSDEIEKGILLNQFFGEGWDEAGLRQCLNLIDDDEDEENDEDDDETA